MSNNNDYKTGNLLDFAHFKKTHNKLVVLVSFQIYLGQQCSLSLKTQKKLLLIFHKTLSQSYK